MERDLAMRRITIICLITGILLLTVLSSVTASIPNAGLATRRTIVAEGIDVSSWQGEIDWDVTAKYVDFVMIRCGEGENLDDSRWEDNIQACIRLNIPFGVYLYSHIHSEESARNEAAHVLRLLKGRMPTLAIYLDVESPETAACTNEEILRYVTIFCDIIEEAGYKAGVYSYASWWEDRMDYPEYDKWERWIAQTGSPLTYNRPYNMWQYTHSETVPGIWGEVDKDYWYGESFLPECTHTYNSEVVQAPSCGVEGRIKYTCTNCGRTYEERIPATSHSYTSTVLQEATCVKDGTVQYCCAKCGGCYEERIPAKGHEFTEKVLPPDEQNTVYIVYTCHCGYSFTAAEITCVNHVAGNGIVTKLPTETEAGERIYACKTCGELLRTEVLPSVAEHRAYCPSSGFVDIPPYMKWCHEGIDMGIRDGLFKGVGNNRFDPDGVMTRAMLVTVLWRFEGCPQASKPSSFVDVVQGSWYADAVAWAQESGLVNGVGNDRFDPHGEITREQFATILYRKEIPASTRNSADPFAAFPDGSHVSNFAKEGLAWAVEKGYIVGSWEVGGVYLFPQGIVTRAQAATIINRLPR